MVLLKDSQCEGSSGLEGLAEGKVMEDTKGEGENRLGLTTGAALAFTAALAAGA